MTHKVIKFKCKFHKDSNEFFKVESFTGHEAQPINYDDAKSWHLCISQGDGESTACGQVYAEYERDSKQMEKGGITCPDCLTLVRELKAIKL